MRALILNCTLKSSPGESNTDALSDVVAAALEEKGIAEVWAGIGEFRALLGESGLKAARQEQALAWMAAALRDGLLAALAADEDIAKETQRLEADVSAGRMTPPAAAERLLARFLQT